MTKRELEIQLSTLRARETEARQTLVRELVNLAARAARAAHRIDTRDWADGFACIGTDIDNMNEAQDTLADILSDLRHAENLSAELPDYDCDRCGSHFHAHGLISTACPDGNGLFTL